MKRNRVLLFGLFTFALVCASLTFVGSTYAKYTSEVSAQGQFEAAKYYWTFDAIGEKDHQTQTHELDLTKDFGGKNYIAPDFKFSREYELHNVGETTLVFTLSQLFKLDGTTPGGGSATNPVKLSAQLKSGENNPVTAYTANDAEITDLTQFSTFELAPGASYTLIITFDWPAEPTHGNANDTIIGRDDTAKWTYQLKVLAVQKVASDAVIE